MKSEPSVHFVRLLAAVRWIADEPLGLGIDNEIQKFQWHLTNQHGAVFVRLHNVDVTVAALDCQANRQ